MEIIGQFVVELIKLDIGEKLVVIHPEKQKENMFINLSVENHHLGDIHLASHHHHLEDMFINLSIASHHLEDLHLEDHLFVMLDLQDVKNNHKKYCIF